MEVKDKKVKKDSKKIIKIVIFALIILFSIFFVATKIVESKIAQSVEIFTEAIKSGDRETANKYVTEDSISFLTFEEIPENQELMNIFIKHLSAEILNVSKNKNEATVRVKFSNKDFEVIMTKYMQEVVATTLSNLDTEISDEEFEEIFLTYLKEQFDSEENQVVTNEVDVKLIKIEDTWKIVVDSNFRNGLFPGLTKIVESMGPQNPY